jgi:hypothetical protein
MSYDPSHRKPRHSGRSSQVITPEEAWPAVEGGAYADGAGYRGDADGQEPQGASWPDRSQPGYQAASTGSADRGHAYRVASGGYGGSVNGYANEWNGWGQRSEGGQGRHSRSSYRTGGYAGTAGTATGGYAGSADAGDWSGWAARGNGYAARTGTFDGAPAHYSAPTNYASAPNGYAIPNGYADDLDAFDGSRNSYTAAPNGYAGASTHHAAAPNGYAGDLDAFDGSPNGYGASDGYAEAQDGFDGPAGYLDHGQYAALSSSDPMLSAPDAGVHPDDWRAEQNRRLEMSQRGAAVSAVTEFLAAAVAVGVSTLAAAFLRPQASPVITAGNVFIDRLPFSLRNFAVQHFGAHSHTVLLLGMYVVLGLLALEIGMLTRRAAAGGVAGIAALSLLGAFIVITRPGSRVTDVMPAVIGGLVGVIALLWLHRASAPAPEYPGRRGRRRA